VSLLENIKDYRKYPVMTGFTGDGCWVD